jgi:hypothetical protein
MLRLVIIILVIVVALLRGGSLRNFGALKLRWLPLVIASFVLQLLIFTPFAKAPLIAVATVPLYIVSMALLTIWVAANWQIHGVVLVAIGLLMNFSAIIVNDGHMPVSPESARYAGTIAEFATGGARIANNSIATDDQVRLWILTDIIPLPQGLPFANVFSIGDVLLTIGVGVLCYRTIHRPPDINRVG